MQPHKEDGAFGVTGEGRGDAATPPLSQTHTRKGGQITGEQRPASVPEPLEPLTIFCLCPFSSVSNQAAAYISSSAQSDSQMVPFA